MAQSKVSSQASDLSQLQQEANSLKDQVSSLQARPTLTVTVSAAQSATPGGTTGSELPAATVNLADPDGQKLIASRYNIVGATQVAINGKVYPFGYVDGACFCSSRSIDFDLSRAYSIFTARIGVRDDSAAGISAQVQVVVDGVTVTSKSVSLGTSYDVRVSVKNALRLRLVTIGKFNIVPAFGDPTVTP
jgi:hypothetical protein